MSSVITAATGSNRARNARAATGAYKVPLGRLVVFSSNATITI